MKGSNGTSDISLKVLFASQTDCERATARNDFLLTQGTVLLLWYSHGLTRGTASAVCMSHLNDSSLEGVEPLNKEYLGNINGLMVKCHMKNGTIQIGFADPYKVYNESEYTGEVDDIIYLWTWDNIDETTHRLIDDDDDKYSQTFIPVKIKYIIRIDAILFSNPRWGGLLTNKFYIDEK